MIYVADMLALHHGAGCNPFITGGTVIVAGGMSLYGEMWPAGIPYTSARNETGSDDGKSTPLPAIRL